MGLLLPASAVSSSRNRQVGANVASQVVVGQRLAEPSSEKDVYEGFYKGVPSVICYPKFGCGSLKREAHVLDKLRGCPNIIKMHTFIEEQNCLILERVEPFGHADLIAVVHRQRVAGRPLPLGQIRYYMMQLAHACRKMGSHGVVHRDLKPDNVLVDRDHTVKVIDFGQAAVQNEEGLCLNEFDEVDNEYCAPEVNSLPIDPAVDSFGLGGILYALCFGFSLKTSRIVQWANSDEGIRGSMHGVHQDIVEAMEGLLCMDPAERWGPDRVVQWASGAEVPQALPSGELNSWPYSEECPQAIGARLPKGWARSGETIGSLDLMRIGGVQIILVDPYSEWQQFYTVNAEEQVKAAYENTDTQALQWQPPTMNARKPVATPNASTVLREGDVIYFGVNSRSACTESLKSVISEHLGLTEDLMDMTPVSLARSPSQTSFLEFFPELVYFQFPPHCVNAVLGQQGHRNVGQNALNLRGVFGINVAAIVRRDGSVSWWPGATEAQGGLVGPGDGALICKVPQWECMGSSILSASVEDIHDVLDVTRFKKRLGLDADDVAWRIWQHNVKGMSM